MKQDAPQAPKAAFLFVALAAVLVGIADAGFILYQEMTQNFACSATGPISCAALTDPKYSRWMGIPVAVYALFFYLFSLWVGSIALKHRVLGRQDESAAKALFGLACFSLVPTVVLAAVSAFVIRAFCPYCLVLYGVSIVFWFSTWRLRRGMAHPRLASDQAMKWGAGFILYMAVVPFVFSRVVPSFRMSATTSAIAGSENRTLGAAQSPHTIAKFSDFQCPMCRKGAQILKELEREERGNVKIVYKYYPLDQACNKNIPRKMHPDSCRAAAATYCAAEQGQFWAFHDLVFENQQGLPAELLESFAKMLNLDVAKYAACMDGRQALEAVRADIDEGDRLGVNATPTLFIDGKKYEGPVELDSLRAALYAGQP